jgi:2,4-dienoyl-CoA reductase-like NADH-dependent reductase (Old Yellow Enzyme family)
MTETINHLFSPLKLRDLSIPNRVIVSPMCQYSCFEGVVTDWHLVHLGSRAVGGAGLVIAEASAVNPVGRISAGDAGIWNEAHVAAWQPITRFIKAHGSVPGIQLAHAGRKASVAAPWTGRGVVRADEPDGWQVVGPSAIEFANYQMPREMSKADIALAIQDFAASTERSLRAGFETVEIHAAHGYLLHQFLSPLANQRADEYGGSLDNRMRFPLAICRAIREAWPAHLPVLLRVSATDWVEGGSTLEEITQFCAAARALGIDMVGVSSSGNALASIPLAPGYQVRFASHIRHHAQVPTYAVGLIHEPAHAQSILSAGDADAIALGRTLLRDPYWPRHAARELGVKLEWPNQYKRCEIDAFGRAVH